MTTKQRNKQIIDKYDTGNFTYEGLAKEYKVSTERIRQIINPVNTQFCKEHKHKYPAGDTCLYHDIDLSYSGELSMVELMEKLHRLVQDKTRLKELVYERKLVIRILKDKYKLTNGFISRLMKMDITTVKHHLGER